MRLILVLGGARSGKSTYAEKLAVVSGRPVLYVATARPTDEEMEERIRRHRETRPVGWRTLEADHHVGSAIRGAARTGECILVDCVTVLAANVILQGGEEVTIEQAQPWLEMEIDELVAALRAHDALAIVVSNEVGMGIVPPYSLGRVYRDLLGWANQRLAAAADEVYFLVAGLPLRLK